MITPKTLRNIERILPFGIIWLTFSIIYCALEKGLLGDLGYYPSTGVPYEFMGSFMITSTSAFLSGLIVGTVETLYLDRVFKNKSFGQKMFYKTLCYLGFMISFLLLNTIATNMMRLEIGVLNEELWRNILVFFTSFAFASVQLYIAAIILISLFYAEISQSLGQGVLSNFFTGKYHTPIQEERIFMFLDMRSSTSHAEKLGHVKYFEMLKDYYADISEPIINHSGEIYQYVGDEIVVSWKMGKGIRENNCIRCFYSMKSALQNQKEKYMNQYGVIPEFKAGFHFGQVTTGEIGIFKKEIIFTGDALNTTARIQGLCNSYSVDLLITEELINELTLEGSFQVNELGESELRGRDQKVKLFTILSD